MSADEARPERRSRATEAFFGRRKGKPLREHQARLIHEELNTLRLDLDNPAPDALTSLYPVPVEKIRLEIGFGGGEHLIHRAKNHADTGFIGVEPFVNSMAKLLSRVRDLGLENIRVYEDDATQLLDWLPEACIDRIDLLYPDPWPKRKHWKRRFVSQVNLDRSLGRHARQRRKQSLNAQTTPTRNSYWPTFTY